MQDVRQGKREATIARERHGEITRAREVREEKKRRGEAK